MKSSLIVLLLLCSFNLIKCYNHSPYNNQYSFNEYDSSKCLNDLDGYTSEFLANSYKANYPVGNDKIMPISYSEIGKLSVSMKDQMMYVHFKIYLDNYIEGRLWGYQSNNTQYVLMNINGTDSCFTQTLLYPVPNKLKVKQIGNVKLGQTPCDIYEIQNGANYTTQDLLVDSKTCAFMSSSVRNPDSSTPGYALINFYNFERDYKQSTFQLPSECYNATPQLQHKSTSFNNDNLPKFFNHFNNNK